MFNSLLLLENECACVLLLISSRFLCDLSPRSILYEAGNSTLPVAESDLSINRRLFKGQMIGKTEEASARLRLLQAGNYCDRACL